jgi:hypothetical protein
VLSRTKGSPKRWIKRNGKPRQYSDGAHRQWSGRGRLCRGNRTLRSGACRARSARWFGQRAARPPVRDLASSPHTTLLPPQCFLYGRPCLPSQMEWRPEAVLNKSCPINPRFTKTLCCAAKKKLVARSSKVVHDFCDRRFIRLQSGAALAANLPGEIS